MITCVEAVESLKMWSNFLKWFSTCLRIAGETTTCRPVYSNLMKDVALLDKLKKKMAWRPGLAPERTCRDSVSSRWTEGLDYSATFARSGDMHLVAILCDGAAR